MSINVTIKAVLTKEESALTKEDQNVAGDHYISLDEGVPESQIADAALDVFHSHVPVSQPDNFEYQVFLNGNRLYASNNHDSYSLSESGSM